jgi:2-polyprenyl-3-methyl-5-hydroxy-6-metoxy-1,4-benzoquinol methylase
VRRGWFKIPGVQEGDRRIEDQLKGLRLALEESTGKKILDLGAAEGLIGNEFLKAGAAAVYGCEVVEEHVEVARKMFPKLEMSVQNLNDVEKRNRWFAKVGKCDTAIMLAILHKLKDPLEVVTEVVKYADPSLIVIRTAERTPGYIQDERSKFQRFEFKPILEHSGYRLELTTRGHFNEWMGYFRKA